MIKKETWLCNNWCVHLLKLRHFHPDSDRPWFPTMEILIFYSLVFQPPPFPPALVITSFENVLFDLLMHFIFLNLFAHCVASAMHQWFDSIIYAHSIVVNWCGGFKWNGAKLFDEVLCSRSQFPQVDDGYVNCVYTQSRNESESECECAMQMKNLKSCVNV